MEKSERGAMAFGTSVINKGPETHSYPVIDLTTKVKINTHTHTCTHYSGLHWQAFMNCTRLHTRSSSKNLADN